MALATDHARINGWLVLARPALAHRYAALRDEARRLRAVLPPEELNHHPSVKLAAQVHRLMTDIVPGDPDHPDFRLTGSLRRFRRAKGHGLPPRYRLFWTYSQAQRVIIFLYLNDERSLRKEGAKSDPYAVFRRMVERGDIGSDFAANLVAWSREYPEDARRHLPVVAPALPRGGKHGRRRTGNA